VKITDIGQKLPHFVSLTRLDRPIGIYLLLWPMLWALWFAAEGVPDLKVLVIFIAGTVLTRSAGCAINDFADRDFDAHVTRTQNRPLATGALSKKEAVSACAFLMFLAFVLVLMTNLLTIALSFVAAVLAVIYPFAKRHTHLPQVILGAAFGFAVPMADLKIGVKSSAILFGHYDLIAVAVFQIVVVSSLFFIGIEAQRGSFYFAGLFASLGFVFYQLYIARFREPEKCIQAFLNNNWMGMTIFIGLIVDYWVMS